MAHYPFGSPEVDQDLGELTRATALGISQASARARTEQTLELRERLTRLWTAVHDGRLAASATGTDA